MHTIMRIAMAATALTLMPAAATVASAQGLKVVASFSIIADFARNVGGDRVAITTLVGPDGDAHVYEPKPSDVAAVANADVFLVNGLHFEGFLTRLVDSSATRASVVDLTRGVTPITMKKEFSEADGAAGDDHGDVDPHAFQSIANAKIYVRNIADGFCAADAAGCETYAANAAAYTARLDATERDVTGAVAQIPEDRRVIITSHDAFGYFENAYGLTFLAPEGLSTEAEPSAADIAALIAQVRDEKAAAIFVENITNPRLIEQIASETGIAIGGTLFSDALSDASGPASTYIDMMEHNIATIKGAINGS